MTTTPTTPATPRMTPPPVPPPVVVLSSVPPSTASGLGAPSGTPPWMRYELPAVEELMDLLKDPANADPKEVHNKILHFMGAISIVLMQESVSRSPSFNRAQTGSRAIDSLRAISQTMMEREKTLHKDRLDFDSPRFRFVIEAMWDLIEVVLKEIGMTEDQVNDFFTHLQSKLPDWEDKMRKYVNSMSFSAKAHELSRPEKTEEA